LDRPAREADHANAECTPNSPTCDSQLKIRGQSKRHALIRPARLGVAAAAAAPVFASGQPRTGPGHGDRGPGTYHESVAITVEGNTISADYYGIFTAGGPVTVRGAQHNCFEDVTSAFGSSPTHP